MIYVPALLRGARVRLRGGVWRAVSGTRRAERNAASRKGDVQPEKYRFF